MFRVPLRETDVAIEVNHQYQNGAHEKRQDESKAGRQQPAVWIRRSEIKREPSGESLPTVESAIQLVELSGEESNQIFDELANWEDVLKGSALGNPTSSAL